MKRKICSLALVFAFFTSFVPSFSALAAVNSASAVFSSKSAATENMSVSMGNGSTGTITEAGGKNGWLLDASDKSSYIKCDIDDSVLNQLESTAKIKMTVEYYDGGRGGFAVYYDSREEDENSVFTQLYNSGEWKTTTFYLNDAYFNNGIKLNDFVIIANDTLFKTSTNQIMGVSSEDVIIGGVSVELADELAPYDVTIATDNFGNIFFEGDTIEFGVTLADASGKYPSGIIQYNVKDVNGKSVLKKSVPFSKNFSSFEIESLPFGTYTLEVAITNSDSNINQKEIADFSYSKKAANPNPIFGTNIHFDWSGYDRTAIRGFADLAKNAGYSITRSSIRWNLIETSEDNFKLPDNIEYSNKYIDQIGLEMLGILTADCTYKIDGETIGCGGPVKPHTENQIKAYADYCAWTVDALKDYTDYWSYINEFNLTPGGGHDDSTKEPYMAILPQAYEAIKGANPHSVIVSGEVGSYWLANRDWIDYCLNHGVLAYSDVFSLHAYDQVGGPETWYIYPAIEHFNDKIHAKNSSKRAWMTETGWPSKDTGVSYATHSMVPYETQAAFYARSMGLNSDPERIDKVIYYSFIDNNRGYFYIEDNYGIVHSHDWRTPFAAKPAYVAVAASNAILDGYTFKEELSGANHDTLLDNGWDTDEYGAVPIDYTDAYFMRRFENAYGDEILMAWQSEDTSAGSFTYDSDKAYFEVYDMYGNKTIVENTNGRYEGNYSSRPVYIHPTDNPDYTGINAENLSSAWKVGSVGKVSVKVNLPKDTEKGSSLKVVAAAYDENGALMNTQIKDATYAGGEIEINFAGAKMKNCKNIKIFALNSFGSLIPLLENEVIPEFGDEASVHYSSSGKTVTISGKLPVEKIRTNVIMTAYSGDTNRADINTAEGFLSSVVAQDMTITDLDGKYSFAFKLPDSFEGDSIKVHIGAKNNSLQKIVYLK